jgi:hypothetical protein
MKYNFTLSLLRLSLPSMNYNFKFKTNYEKQLPTISIDASIQARLISSSILTQSNERMSLNHSKKFEKSKGPRS